MKTLQECKDVAADNWFLNSCGTSGDYRTLSNGVKVGNIKQRNLESVMDDAAERYASQFREPSTEQSGGTEHEQNIVIEDLMNEFASDWLHKFDEIPDIYSEIRAKFIITRKPLDR